MKPLPVAPYTDEDWDLMKCATVRWMMRHQGPFGIARVYVTADRRDAALMLKLEQSAAPKRSLASNIVHAIGPAFFAEVGAL